MTGNKPKKRKPLKTFLIPILRHASLRWWARTEALSRARVERGLYKCAMCAGEFKKAEVHVDHIIPVVKVRDGFTNWDDYINSLFVSPEELAILCIPCHNGKSDVELELRKNYKSLTKE